MTKTRTPIILLTGFLGSGKTTLLNAWLKRPSLAQAAVIVNEFGDIGIDSDLIAASDDTTIELTNGCLCCTVRGDLVETLRDLMVRQRRGEIRQVREIVIETTGLADPGPVIQALMTSPVALEYRLARVITAIDAPQGLGTLERFDEARKQIAVADDIVITKSDLVDEVPEALTAKLRQLNPGHRLFVSTPESVPDPVDDMLAGAYDPSLKPEDVRQWLTVDAFEAQDGHGHDHGRHDDGISSFCLTFDEELEWQAVAAWLDALVIAHGEDLLRVKGILAISGRREPIVVQSVQKLFHPPFALEGWPEGRRHSRIVFITRGISETFVRQVFDTIRGVQIDAPATSSV